MIPSSPQRTSEAGTKRQSLRVVASFTAEPIEEPLRFWTRYFGEDQAISFAGFNQVWHELLHPDSLTRRTEDGINFFFLRASDLKSADSASLPEFAHEEAERLRTAFTSFKEAHKARFSIIVICPEANELDAEKSQHLKEALAPLHQAGHFEVWLSKDLLSSYPVDTIHDPESDQSAHLPYTDVFFTALATALFRRIDLIRRPPIKVFVTDCDHTLWSGVCGEAAIEELVVTPAHRSLHEIMQRCAANGVLLALCSKNNPEDVWEVLEKHPDIPFNRKDFVATKINWLPKGANLEALANELNLAPSSFLFLDDNPSEIAQIREALPEILAFRLPVEEKAMNLFLAHLWPLDLSVTRATEEDTLRSASYRDEAERQRHRNVFDAYHDFLESLELTLDIRSATEADLPRVAQLFVRTNQFNNGAPRWTETDLRQIHSSDDQEILCISAKDRFGDYGIIGACVLNLSEVKPDILGIDAFLLSCRALGKGIEHQILVYLAKLAVDHSRNRLVFRFTKMDRNTPAEEFFTQIEAQRTREGFEITQESAANASTRPIQEHTPSVKPSPQAHHTSETPSETYQKIASELNRTSAIMEAIRSDRRHRDPSEVTSAPSRSETGRILTGLWCEVLNIDLVGEDERFSNLGGTSVQLVRLHTAIVKEFGIRMEFTELFHLPTVRDQAKHIDSVLKGDSKPSSFLSDERTESKDDVRIHDVAIIGMALRVPGAHTPEAFWDNLVNGVESITRLTDDELASSGFDVAELKSNPRFVPAKGLLEGSCDFDAKFFNMLPKEAKHTDPQHRVFLELCWEALERGGYDPTRYPGAVGVFAGAYMDTYLLANLCSDPAFLTKLIPEIQVGDLQTELGNDKDYLATRVAYKLNLRGPAMTLQTACSTSMVAVNQAYQAVATGACEMALAGGITITFPEKKGYVFEDGSILAKDGHCRTFDHRASGTVFSNGAGVVLLKRLSDAIADGDHIHAVIKGAALNNDGGVKHSFTAPSVEGQADVIRRAQRMAEVTADSIGYIEAHGTATPLGDPIEISALNRAFSQTTDKKGFCAIGSVKSNIGHLDTASGVVGIIKTALALEHRQIPALLGFEKPNPKIDFENSPFVPASALTEWKSDTPRRAGVSSFGVGGTNGHVILEEAPAYIHAEASPRPAYLFPLSAKTTEAVDQVSARLAEYAKDTEVANPSDVAFTLQVGRAALKHRRVVVASDLSDLQTKLSTASNPFVVNGSPLGENPPIVFMFPGQGAQHPEMGRELYENERVFRDVIDECAEKLKELLGTDIRETLFPSPEAREGAADRLRQTTLAQPAIFVIEYATAKLLMHWGIRPSIMVGHSVGEFVAACLADVFSLEDGLRILSERGRLMGDLPGGAMLSVRTTEEKLSPFLNSTLDLAATNGPNLCVVSGPNEAIDDLVKELEASGIASKKLHTSHAFHSWMMDPILPSFGKMIQSVPLQKPTVPIFSSVTNQWLDDSTACDPTYWTNHLRQPVRFLEVARHLWTLPDHILIEVGPGQTLSTLTRQNPDKTNKQTILSTNPHATTSEVSPYAHLLLALGRLWIAGCDIPWDTLSGPGKRVPLPTYPFEKQRFYIEPGSLAPGGNFTPESQAHIPPASHTPSESMNMPASAAAIPDRCPAICDALKELLADLSGIEPPDMDPTATFLELGFDSLLLTQVAKTVQDEFKVTVTMRDLFASISSIEALVAHLDHHLPADRFAPTPSVQPSPEPIEQEATAAAVAPPQPIQAAMPSQPHNTPVPALAPRVSDGSLESLVSQQLELMRHQLALLQGTPTPQTAPEQQPAQVVPAPSPQPTKPLQQEEAAAPTPPPAISFTIDRSEQTLSARQRAHLDDLIRRYTSKTARSKALTQKHRRHYADPRTASGFNRAWKEMCYQIVTERSKGSRLSDIDGNEYIDMLNGFGPGFLGHSPDFIVEAIESQLHLGFEVGPQSRLAGETAELFCELTGNERASFVNTGSEAVQAAMRLARTVTGRDKIAMFTKDYHGNFDEVLVRGNNRNGELRSMPIAPGIPKRAVSDMLVLDYGTEESLEIIRQHAHELAAVMVEPMQSRRPEFQPKEFIRELRKITEETGCLFVFDEVITGFRTGKGGAQAYYGVKADLATYGKVIGGGMPIGVVAGKSQYMDTFDGGFWQYGDDSFPTAPVTFFAGTFVRHPLSIAACHAMLLHFKAQGPALWDTLNARCHRLATTVDSFFVENQVPFRLPHFCSQMFVRVQEDQKYANLLFFHLREKGVFLLESFPSYMTCAHTEEDVDYVIAAYKESVAEMQAGGFFEETAHHSTLNCSRLSGPPRLLTSENTSAPSQDQDEIEERIVPLTPPQMEVLLASKHSLAANCVFNELTTLELKGSLDIPALQWALDTVFSRHDALRACVTENGESLLILPEISLPITPVEGDLAEILRSEADTPFLLTQAPLARAQLLKRAEDDHVLILNFHHIVCDGWSYNVVMEDLSALYNAKTQGLLPKLERSPHFADYASQAGTLHSPEDETYWLSKFQTPPAPLDLPTDHPHPAIKSFNGGTERRVLDATLLKDLRKAGGRCGGTLLSTLLSAFNVLLHRFTGQEDIVTGIPCAGQQDEGYEDLVGHCVNFLPIRTQITQSTPFREIVKAVQGDVLSAFEHKSFGYGQIVQQLDLPRDGGRMPLTEVGFNLERMDYHSELHGLQSRFDAAPKSFVNHTFFIHAIESSDGLTLDCNFSTDLFDRETITHWLACFEELLRSIVKDPESPAGKFNLLSPHDRQKLIQDWSGVAHTTAPAGTVLSHFAEEVQTRPEAIALQSDSGTLTYLELDRMSDSVAAQLASEGAPIAIVTEPCMETIAALLGILKTGGSYVPIDPACPLDRAKHMITDSSATAIVCKDTANWAATDVPTLDVLALTKGNFPYHGSGSICAETPAYIIYTSGSTGTPKGVTIPHRGIVRLVKDTNYAHFGPDEVFLQAAPVSFDASTFEIWGPLLNGGKLVLLPSGAPSLSGIAQAIEKHGITIMFLTTGLFQALVEEHLDSLKPLRQLLTGGEVLSPIHAKRVLAAFPNMRFSNVYGPTENTTFTTFHPITSTEYAIPIGKPIHGTEVYVLDPLGNPQPQGVPGELFVAGSGLALGYINANTLNAEKFVSHPFKAGAKAYRSGDLCRFLNDGSIAFLGRMDRQIKIRGFRIEPGEIEGVLNSLPGVRQSLVLASGDSVNNRKLVAYTVAPPDTNPTSLREDLAARLPAYLVPASIQILSELPINANGKVDLKALPSPTHDCPVDREREEPTTITEHHLAKLWEGVLKHREFGIHDRFLDVGGNSLLGLRLFTRLEKQLGPALPLSTLFTAPTISELGKLIDLGFQKEGLSVTPIRKGGSKAPLFCIHGGGGGVLFYSDMAEAMSGDRTVYGIESPMLLDAGVPTEESIEETAAKYLGKIKAIHPEGPYLLAGYSFGGLVAYEIAQQLIAHGDKVGELVLFDTANPSVRPVALNVAGRLTANWASGGESSITSKLLRLGGRFGTGLVSRIKTEAETAAAGVLTKVGVAAQSQTLRAVQVREAYSRAMDAYEPSAYPGSMLLFTAHENAVNDKFRYENDLGWKGLVSGNLEILSTPGAHLTIFDAAHGPVLAEKLQRHLDRLPC